MMGRASAFGAGEVFRGSKSKAPPASPAGALLPLSCDLLFRAKDLFMAATVSIFPCRGKDEEGVSTPGFDRAGLQSERPKGACPPKNGRTVSDCGAYGIAEHRRAYGRAEKVRTWLRAAAHPGSRRAATRPHSGARVSGAQGSTAQGSTAQGSAAQGSTRRSPGDGR